MHHVHRKKAMHPNEPTNAHESAHDQIYFLYPCEPRRRVVIRKDANMSHIREFYSGANVMLTGATGLVGKLLISKILIEVQDVGGFYLVIREKRSKSARQRLDELFDDPVS